MSIKQRQNFSDSRQTQTTFFLLLKLIYRAPAASAAVVEVLRIWHDKHGVNATHYFSTSYFVFPLIFWWCCLSQMEETSPDYRRNTRTDSCIRDSCCIFWICIYHSWRYFYGEGLSGLSGRRLLFDFLHLKRRYVTAFKRASINFMYTYKLQRSEFCEKSISED